MGSFGRHRAIEVDTRVPFPRAVSMSPGPATIAQHPRDYAAQALARLPADVVGKLLHDNAARAYHVA